MPLLPQEPCIFPDDLLTAPDDHPGPEEAPPARWWVLHTRPRTEKSLARRLLARSVSFYLPQGEKQRISSGRLQSSHLPLFPGYVFLRGAEDSREAALETNLIVNCLPVHDQKGFLSDLVRVFRLIDSGMPLTSEPSLAPGDLVEIVEGSLTGLWGRVLGKGRKLTFAVDVQMLQQRVSIEIERWMIRPLAESADDQRNNGSGTNGRLKSSKLGLAGGTNGRPMAAPAPAPALPR